MVWFIITIILKVLLILICILAALVALLLLVPFRYEIRAENNNPTRYEELPGMDALEHFSTEVRIRWLFGFFSAFFRYRRDGRRADGDVKILWFRLPVNRLFSRNSKRKKKSSSGEWEKSSSGFFERVRTLKEKFDKYQKVLCSRCAGRAFSFLKEQLLLLLLSVLPEKWELSGELGSGDPAATGRIIQLISFIYPFSPESIQMSFDFEDFCADIRLRAKGRIRMLTVLIHVLKILSDKDVKKVFRALRAIRAGRMPAANSTKPAPA